ncbi:MAG TPA: hypothetical protein VGL45_05945 [Bradyrhizobium sp.]|jgi:hypothetical protein
MMASTVLVGANRGSVLASNFLAAAMPRSQRHVAMRKSRQPRCAAANSIARAAYAGEATAWHPEFDLSDFAARDHGLGYSGVTTLPMASS